MMKETYVKRDTSEKIKINISKCMIKIGNHNYYLGFYEIKNIKKLYKYNKEIFKEFIENIYTKYNVNTIEFLINNNITLEEIKALNNIILFQLEINKEIVLSEYRINIVDFFKYLYSQPYEFISWEFIKKYGDYLETMNKKKEINKIQ